MIARLGVQYPLDDDRVCTSQCTFDFCSRIPCKVKQGAKALCSRLSAQDCIWLSTNLHSSTWTRAYCVHAHSMVSHTKRNIGPRFHMGTYTHLAYQGFLQGKKGQRLGLLFIIATTRGRQSESPSHPPRIPGRLEITLARS